MKAQRLSKKLFAYSFWYRKITLMKEMWKELIEAAAYETVHQPLDKTFELFPIRCQGKKVLTKPNEHSGLPCGSQRRKTEMGRTSAE